MRPLDDPARRLMVSWIIAWLREVMLSRGAGVDMGRDNGWLVLELFNAALDDGPAAFVPLTNLRQREVGWRIENIPCVQAVHDRKGALVGYRLDLSLPDPPAVAAATDIFRPAGISSSGPAQ